MAIWSRLHALALRWSRPAAWERALRDELQAYVEHEIDARIARGIPPEEAHRTALAEIRVEQVKEHVRETATGARLETLWVDWRAASGALRHSRGFAAWVVGSLAIGMAVAIAALAFLNTLLFGLFPGVSDQARLVRVAVGRSCGRPDCWIRMSSEADYSTLQEGLTGVQGLAAYSLGQVAAALPRARSMRAAFASANYFDVLGVHPAAGRAFHTSDADTDAAIAVIAHRLWVWEFDSDPSVIGRSIRVADVFVRIIGVAPEFFVGIDLKPARGDRGPDIWLPIWLADGVLPLARAEQRRQERDMYFVGRLRDGVELSLVQAEAGVVATRLAGMRGGSQVRANVQRVWMGNPEQLPLAVTVILPIPVMVLVIACVNAANLMLARGSQRQREIAIRLAIGAGRSRIIRQLLIESSVLALLATGVALPVAWWSLQLANSPVSIPIPIDATVLALTVLTAAGTAVAFGLVPALRVSSQQPSITLGSVGARGDTLPRQSRSHRILLMAQVALSLGLLATAWQLVATVRSQAVSTGTPPDRLLIARFDLQPLDLGQGEVERFYSELAARASRLPGVEAVGLARHTSVWTFGQGPAPGAIVVWHPTDAPEDGRLTVGGYAGSDLFQALGLRILHGRGFSDADRFGRPKVAVVNRTFAESMTQPALGAVIQVASRDRDFDASIEVQIVGIIEATFEPRFSPDDRPAPKVYLPSSIEPEPALALYLRPRGSAVTVAQPVRELVSQIAPRVPILEVGSLQELNERSYGPQLWLARAAACLGAIGLLLATAGLYGVSSYVVAMRSRELAIRIALGARPRTILTMMLNQSMRVALIGLLVGGSAAAVVSRVIQAEYHGIEGISGAAFGGAAALFLAAMLLASVIPAVRASRVDPVENLKDA